MTAPDPYTFGSRPPIFLTEVNRLRLSALVADDPIVARFLQEELVRAEIVTRDIPGLVTVGSTVKFDDHRLPHMRTCKLVYPDEVTDGRNVSVLSLLGVALLGLSVGQSMTWDDETGQQRITVLDAT